MLLHALDFAVSSSNWGLWISCLTAEQLPGFQKLGLGVKPCVAPERCGLDSHSSVPRVGVLPRRALKDPDSLQSLLLCAAMAQYALAGTLPWGTQLLSASLPPLLHKAWGYSPHLGL